VSLLSLLSLTGKDPRAVTGRRLRRIAASSTAVLGSVDVIQAASRRSIARLGWLSLHLGGTTTRLFRYVLLLAALMLFSAARGLLRGKRVAWLLAITAAGASVVGHHLVKADALGIILALGVVVLLMVSSERFRARPDPSLARRGILWLILGAVATYTYGVGGLYLLDSQFRQSTSLAESLRQSARLLFLLPTSTIDPITKHGAWFIDSVRVMAAAVLLIGIARLLHPVVMRGAQRDRSQVVRVLEASADTALAYFHLLSDKHYLFSSDGTAFVGYKVIGSVAVCLGGPIGSSDAREEVARTFLELCELNGWIPSFHQVNPEGLAMLNALGLKSLKIGEEAIIDVEAFSLIGSHFKSIRSKTGRMARDGWSVKELPQPIDEHTMDRLRAISEAWLAHGNHRERTFTLGRFDEEYLRSTSVLAVLDPSGSIQAFANVIPTYRSSVGTFDLMRRNPDEHNPVMDFLFLSMIERFRNDGFKGMNLGLAPLSNIVGDSLADRALRALYERGGRAFNFGGLHDFKKKWLPRWEPSYLVYRADTELPQIALAVSRAGELPHADTSRLETSKGWLGSMARAIVSVGRRLPCTAVLAAVVGVLQIITLVDRDSYDGLHATYTYNWSDLANRHQLYRAFTAIFIEQGHGIRLGILSMLPMVAAAEYVLRPLKTLLVFFLGDLCSSIPILLIMRLAAAAGSEPASRSIASRDGGTSSAMFAVIMAAALSLSNPRLRRFTITAVVAFLLITAVLYQRLFDFQHIGAALVGLVCWWTLIERPRRSQPVLVGSNSES
jgi:phosphatidylglycerol lysyltransferase